MADDTNEDRYSYGDMRRILSEVRKNPDTHGYPAELIEKFETYNEKLRIITESSPHYIMAKKIELINSTLRTNPFLEALEQSPIYQMAQRIKQISESLPSLYGEVYGNFSQLSEHGWYLSTRVFEAISLSELARLFRMEDKEELEHLIVSEAEQMIPEMLENCRIRFANRKDVFTDIENLFNMGQYRAAIVLAYTQADGISNDTFKNGFFDTETVIIEPEEVEDNDTKVLEKPKKEIQLKNWVKIQDMDVNHSLGVIGQLGIRSNEISAYTKEGKYLDQETRRTSFNRHLILHGHSVEYGTKQNAIRAICILDFLHFIITEAVEIDTDSKKS